MTEITDAVRQSAQAAAQASVKLRTVSDETISQVLRTAAELLPQVSERVLAANAEDMATARTNGMSEGLLDRLELNPERIQDAVAQLLELAEIEPGPRMSFVRTLPSGEEVFERDLPVGVIGATYEARPAVTLDVAGQVLRARSAAVLRTGSAAIGTSAVLVDEVLAPALAAAGLPEGAVTLIRQPGHASAEALVQQPDLIPLVIVRGSGETTRHLSQLGASAGTRVLSHADGGGVLYVDAGATTERLQELLAAGTDRLGVCNRLNLLLIHEDRWDEFAPVVTQTLADQHVTALLPPHEHRLGHEWALDSGNESHVTVAAASSPEDAALLAGRETSGIAATICTEDEAAALEFLGAWGGTGAFWNSTTRLLDGYKLLGVPETGITVDQVPGPRGPVTYPDLVLRQFVVLPAGTAGERVAQQLTH